MTLLWLVKLAGTALVLTTSVLVRPEREPTPTCCRQTAGPKSSTSFAAMGVGSNCVWSSSYCRRETSKANKEHTGSERATRDRLFRATVAASANEMDIIELSATQRTSISMLGQTPKMLSTSERPRRSVIVWLGQHPEAVPHRIPPCQSRRPKQAANVLADPANGPADNELASNRPPATPLPIYMAVMREHLRVPTHSGI